MAFQRIAERLNAQRVASNQHVADGVQKRYFNDHGWIVLDMLSSVAAEHDAPPAEVALAWLLARPAIAAPIIGANTPEQLAASLGATDLALSTDQIARLDAASAWQD